MITRVLQALGVVATEAVTIAQWVNDLPPDIRKIWLDATRSLVKGDPPDKVSEHAYRAALRAAAMRSYRP